MIIIFTDRATWLLSASPSGTGAPLDNRATLPYGYLLYNTVAASAVITMQASINTTGWMDIVTFTASANTGTAQHSGFYPYVRGVVNLVYSGAGNTGFANLYFAPGMG